MPVHGLYGAPLPMIKTIRLEENIAEKIARLNRVTTARDMYDLAWMATTKRVARSMDWSLVRALAVLKVWVDANGLGSPLMEWGRARNGGSFDPDRWLRPRGEEEFDLEDIGALAVPPPSAASLAESVAREYGFLRDLSADERAIARADERDRALAIRMLEALPDGRLKGIGLF